MPYPTPRVIKQPETVRVNGTTYTIRERERKIAVKLIEAGFYSTSNKYRSLARWKALPPDLESLIKPEFLANLHVQRLLVHARRFNEWSETDLRCCSLPEEELIEQLELSERMFWIFRACGGHTS